MKCVAAEGTHTLWGTPHSLYTGKIRCYLIKKGIRFREIFPPHPRFRIEIKPAVRLKVAPIIETPDGRILQDTSDMIDYFESSMPEPLMIPRAPVQRTVAWLIGAFGSEGALPAAIPGPVIALRGTTSHAVTARTEAVRIATVQYKAGRRDLLWVSNLQTAQLANEADLIALRSLQRVNRIRLYLALGGSFDADPATTVQQIQE